MAESQAYFNFRAQIEHLKNSHGGEGRGETAPPLAGKLGQQAPKAMNPNTVGKPGDGFNAKDFQFPEVEMLKKQGNDFFSLNLFPMAVAAYSEAIMKVHQVVQEKNGLGPPPVSDDSTTDGSAKDDDEKLREATGQRVPKDRLAGWTDAEREELHKKTVEVIMAENAEGEIKAGSARDLLSKLFCNRSNCFHKLDKFDESMGDAEESVLMDPGFIKGYMRSAQAALKLIAPEKAMQYCFEGMAADEAAGNGVNKVLMMLLGQAKALEIAVKLSAPAGGWESTSPDEEKASGGSESQSKKAAKATMGKVYWDFSVENKMVKEVKDKGTGRERTVDSMATVMSCKMTIEMMKSRPVVSAFEVVEEKGNLAKGGAASNGLMGKNLTEITGSSEAPKYKIRIKSEGPGGGPLLDVSFVV